MPAPALRRLAWIPALLLLGAVALAALWAAPTPEGHRPLRGTLTVALCAGACAALLGTASALCAERARWRRLWTVLLAAPLLIPPFLTVVAFRATCGPGGHLPRLLGLEAGGPSVLMQSWIYSAPCAGLLQGVSRAPLVFLAVSAALARLPAGPLEAARLARGPWGERALLARALRPAILLGVSATVALSAIEFAGPILLRVPVQAEQVLQAFDAERDAGLALRRALPLLGLSACGLLIPLASWRAPLPGGRRRDPAPRAWAGPVCALLLTCGLWLPLGELAWRLIQRQEAASVLRGAWGVAAGDAWRTLQVGLGAGALATSVGLSGAWLLRRAPRPLVATALFPAACLAACPPALLAVGFLVALNRPGWVRFLDSLACVALACALRFGPFALALLCLATRAWPRAREDAARLAGRSPLPLLMRHLAPAALAAFGLVYLLSATEYGASALLAPPGQSLLAVFVVNEAHYGQGAELAALSALLLATALAPLAVLAAGAWACAPRWSRA